MSPARIELYRLERDGGFVFHGSGEDLDVLDPRQAHNVKDGKSVDDGPPAVFAAKAADYAVFMAVFSKRNCPLGRHTRIASWSFRDGDYRLVFQASPNTLSQIDERSYGWVYIFPKEGFYQREPGGLEYTNRKAVKPIKKIRVERADILGKIDAMG
ncbi:MAG: hypothetical protein HZA81_00230 [Candidatus Taylorbacteria bacterium]|nr:hypothetical protein [Candidatus Taylorbacteria bacterium]